MSFPPSFTLSKQTPRKGGERATQSKWKENIGFSTVHKCTLCPFFLVAGMTVPGAGSSHQDEKDQTHRYRHDKRAAEASSNTGDRQKFAGLYTGPYFDPAMPSNISVQLGDTALLICKVNQVGRKTVRILFGLGSQISYPFFLPGVLDSQTRLAYLNSGQQYIHFWRQILHFEAGKKTRVDITNQVRQEFQLPPDCQLQNWMKNFSFGGYRSSISSTQWAKTVHFSNSEFKSF